MGVVVCRSSGCWRANKLLAVFSLLWGVVGLCLVANLARDLPLRLKGQVYYVEGFPEILKVVVRQSDYNYSYYGRIGNVEVRLDEPFLKHRCYWLEYMPHSKIIVYINHFEPPKERE
ncbi:hypothetical protein CBW65_08770 [Tumebacillus avium]|uniref:Uncharacterized protein n=1 Tax=Tumebacillus avium TaxID=1903704 RepID=A0A1Y0IMQ8_9BACL|nr:hypothetical protein [Tumebacillus avium]ARU61116.1 hypothetical protein CBW65_08770 [Tumebacillus avium]